MFDPPKTIKEAMEYRYGAWAGNPRGHGYITNICAYEIRQGHISAQCGRGNGHGPNGLYCKQHAKIVEGENEG